MLERLDEAIDALNAVDLDSLDDASLDDLVVGLRERCSRLAAAEARLLARWDARMVWADDGSKAPWARLAREHTGSDLGGAFRMFRMFRVQSGREILDLEL